MNLFATIRTLLKKWMPDVAVKHSFHSFGSHFQRLALRRVSILFQLVSRILSCSLFLKCAIIPRYFFGPEASHCFANVGNANRLRCAMFMKVEKRRHQCIDREHVMQTVGSKTLKRFRNVFSVNFSVCSSWVFGRLINVFEHFNNCGTNWKNNKLL